MEYVNMENNSSIIDFIIEYYLYIYNIYIKYNWNILFE